MRGEDRREHKNKGNGNERGKREEKADVEVQREIKEGEESGKAKRMKTRRVGK